MAEAHLPPAQTAASWTTARPLPPRRLRPRCRSPSGACAPRSSRRAAASAAALSGSRARCTRRRGARPLRHANRDGCPARRRGPCARAGPSACPAGRPRERRRRATASAAAGDAADVRPERRSARARADVGRDEDDVARGRPPGRRGCPSAEEPDVDRAVGELRVEAADDEALRAVELVLHLLPKPAARRGQRRPTARRRGRTSGSRGTRSSRAARRRRARRAPRARAPRRRARASRNPPEPERRERRRREQEQRRAAGEAVRDLARLALVPEPRAAARRRPSRVACRSRR